ncbi:helix-turn-helix transcriptional regulator [Harryflintia acetispora]|uniref:helix-turn-helix transcriptional regulator n=1 Tax=Harryflintia acetispora TaxID=1849041 RepID=UPI003307073F
MATKLPVDADTETKTAVLSLKFKTHADCGKIIKAYRLDHQITQKEFAAMAGIAETTLRLWELGRTVPSYRTWKRIKMIMGVP